MKHLLVSIFLMSFTILFAQSSKVSVQEGAEFKESKKERFAGIISTDKTGYYAIRSKKSTHFLEHYNKKLNKTLFTELNLKEGKKDKDYEFTLSLNNKIYVFSSFKNQKLKKKFLFSQSVNKKTLQVNNDLKKIAEIDYSSKSRYKSGGFSYEVSPDSSKVLIHYGLPYKKDENQKIGFHVLDVSTKQLWAKKMNAPHKSLSNIQDYRVDNDGNVHILGIVYEGDTRKYKRRGKPNYHYEIVSYYSKGTTVKKYPVKIEGKFLTDMQIQIGTNQNIICAGFYSSQGTWSVEGTYFLKINKNSRKIVSKNFKKFDIDFITQNMSVREEKRTKKKKAKGKNVELYEYDLDELIIKPDGSVYLIGEQYYVRVVTTTTTDSNGNTRTTTTYHYYYNDIIVINFSAAGEVKWAEKILKKQHTINDGGFYSSYVACIDGDNIFFVFNDHVKNLYENDKNKYSYFTKSKKSSTLVMVEINNKGQEKKEVVFDAKNYPILVRPLMSSQVSKNEVILLGQRKKVNKLTKLTFKKSKSQTY